MNWQVVVLGVIRTSKNSFFYKASIWSEIDAFYFIWLILK
jgi:hypothetical protein